MSQNTRETDTKAAEDQYIKRMADLLRQGQTLTELACPVCASPLFRLKSGELWCARCEKKVIVVKEETELTKVTSALSLETLEATLLAKIQEIQEK
ncbi:MAG: Sjogren's syndrome/scleroderma autoantigen 1 family protein, partial [Candidatus Bathyarchaeia archaeon]